MVDGPSEAIGKRCSASNGRKGRPSAAETRDRQMAVLAAARVEFLRHGFRDATMHSIAVAAGVSKRSLYLWHGNKSALFRACITEGTIELKLPRLDPALEPRAALTAFGAVLLPAVSTRYAMDMTRLLFREASDSADVRAALVAGAEIISRPIVEYLTARGFSPTRALHLADIFMIVLTARINRAALHGEDPPDITANVEHLAVVVQLMCDGLPPREPIA